MDEALDAVDAVKHLRLAEPSIGVRAILTRLRPTHPELDSRAIRDALLTPVTTPQPTLLTTPPRTGRYLYGMPNTPEIVTCLQGSGTSKVVPHVCSGCMRSGAVTELKPCGRCEIARYCSTTCQEKMWAAHRPFCKSVAEHSSLLRKSVKRCAHAIRSFGMLGVTMDTAAKWTHMQRQRFAGICASICAHAQGRPCNVLSDESIEPELLADFQKCAECHREVGIFFDTELHVREWVVSGLCQSCQDEAYHIGKVIAGPDQLDDPAPPVPDELDDAVAVYLGPARPFDGWHWMMTDHSYRCIAPLWEGANLDSSEMPAPLVVANERFAIRRYWHKRRDGSVYIAVGEQMSEAARAQFKRHALQVARSQPAGSGVAVVEREMHDAAASREVEIRTSVLRDAGRRQLYRFGSVSTVYDTRGLPWQRQTMSLARFVEVPSVVRALWLCRIESWKFSNVQFRDCKEESFEATYKQVIRELKEAARVKPNDQQPAWCIMFRYMIKTQEDPASLECLQWRDREDYVYAAETPSSITDRTREASTVFREKEKEKAAEKEANRLKTSDIHASVPTCELDAELIEWRDKGLKHYYANELGQARVCFERALTAAERTLPLDSFVCISVQHLIRLTIPPGTDEYLASMVESLSRYETRHVRDLLTLAVEEWTFARCQVTAYGANGFLSCALGVLLALNTATPGFRKAHEYFPPFVHLALERAPHVIVDLHKRRLQSRILVEDKPAVCMALYGTGDTKTELSPVDILWTMRRFIDAYRVMLERVESVGTAIHGSKKLEFECLIARVLPHLPS